MSTLLDPFKQRSIKLTFSSEQEKHSQSPFNCSRHQRVGFREGLAPAQNPQKYHSFKSPEPKSEACDDGTQIPSKETQLDTFTLHCPRRCIPRIVSGRQSPLLFLLHPTLPEGKSVGGTICICQSRCKKAIFRRMLVLTVPWNSVFRYKRQNIGKINHVSQPRITETFLSPYSLKSPLIPPRKE